MKKKLWVRLSMALLWTCLMTVGLCGVSALAQEDGAADVTLEVQLGRVAELLPQVMTDGPAPDITWTSSDPTVVSVDERGVLTTYGFGEATISAVANDGSGMTATYAVTVPAEELDIASASVIGCDEVYEYTGHPFEPELTVSFRDITLIPDVHYQVAYSDSFMPGPAAITVEGIGAFSGAAKVDYAIAYTVDDEVAAAVQNIVDICAASGIVSEYDKAVFMHDWLIYHANYDYTYTEYGPEGVLIKGTGVCNSYALAYQLLLDKVGIQNTFVSSVEMNHAWNLVKLGGEWCHVDCTWDDPGTGGQENSTYFGMNDALMSRDHVWIRGDYPAADSLANYYLLRTGSPVAANSEEFAAVLSEQAAAQEPAIRCWYIGEDSTFDIHEEFQKWFGLNNARYGIAGYSGSFGQFSFEITPAYTDPWEKPGGLEQPVPCPDFALDGPLGVYKLNNYSRNGLLLVFGSRECSNTAALLAKLHGEVDSLAAGGIDVLINLESTSNPADYEAMAAAYPKYHYTYSDSRLMFAIAANVGCTDGFVYPLVAVVNSDGMITYYSTGYVTDFPALLSEARAVGTGNAVPPPEPIDLTNKIEVDLSSAGESAVRNELMKLSRQAAGVTFLYDYSPYNSGREMLDEWAANRALYEALGMKLVACYANVTADDLQSLTQQYPGVLFVEDDQSIFWNLLHAVGFAETSARYLSTYLINGHGQIIDYANGSALSLRKAALRLLNGLTYDWAMPANLTRIEKEAFAGAEVQYVDLAGTDLTEIGAGTFADCKNLRVVRIPSTVKQIDDTAFDGCDKLVILCSFDTAAYRYAAAHGIPCLTY